MQIAFYSHENSESWNKCQVILISNMYKDNLTDLADTVINVWGLEISAIMGSY